MIYADHNGSSPVLPQIREYLKKRLDSQLFANPNAIHSKGMELRHGIEICREKIAEKLGAQPRQIIFNSGSSESISHVLNHLLLSQTHKKTIIASPIEHAAVLNTILYYEKKFHFNILWIPVSKEGMIDLEWIKNKINEHKNDLALLVCMAANNETGIIFPFAHLQKLANDHNANYFCDTTQILGKEEFNFAQSHLDFAILSGHKIGALPGVGALLIKDPELFSPFIHGGGQEFSLRGGTQNYLGIETLAYALEIFDKNKDRIEKLKKAKLAFELKLKTEFPQISIIGQNQERICGTSLIGYPGLHSQGVQIELESLDIFVTTSSACSDNEPSTSKTLNAMRIDDQLGRSVVRISLSLYQGAEDYENIYHGLKSAFKKLTKIEYHHVL